MQRPVMNPTFYQDAPAPVAKRLLLARTRRMLKWIVMILLASPFGRRGNFRNEDGSALSRCIRTLMYRLAFFPLLLVAFLAAIVLAATHPDRSSHGADPMSVGVYYDPVDFLADDGARLEAWMVPALDARRLLAEKEEAVSKRYPAVVLVHDCTGSRQQFLPLIKPLHDAGMVVLAMNLRGATSLSNEAQTFGLRESRDVKAAVDMLRRRAFVDPTRIALIGLGTGANACLLAARADPTLDVMVLADPANNFDQAFADRVGPDHFWLPPLRAMFRWTFEIMYGADTGDLDPATFTAMIEQRHVMMSEGRDEVFEPAGMKKVQAFLQAHLLSGVALAQ